MSKIKQHEINDKISKKILKSSTLRKKKQKRGLSRKLENEGEERQE